MAVTRQDIQLLGLNLFKILKKVFHIPDESAKSIHMKQAIYDIRTSITVGFPIVISDAENHQFFDGKLATKRYGEAIIRRSPKKYEKRNGELYCIVGIEGKKCEITIDEQGCWSFYRIL
jgi:hypothetical protein